MRCLVAGAGGFIGGALVRRLKAEGHYVNAVDIKPQEHALEFKPDVFRLLDLRDPNAAKSVFGAYSLPFDEVYQLAADRGGMGYVDGKDSQILHNNTLINTHMLAAATAHGVERYLFASSACVYPESAQMGKTSQALAEHEAFPAYPQDAYGWENLLAEMACRYTAMQTRIARLYSIYGPGDAWTGGREKSLAALCRKVAEAPDGGEIEVWGDGSQIRTYLYIDDAVRGIIGVMRGDQEGPYNIGDDFEVTTGALAKHIIDVSGKCLGIKYVPGPMGVQSRTPCLARAKRNLGWEPTVSLSEGVKRAYNWIEQKVTSMVPA